MQRAWTRGERVFQEEPLPRGPRSLVIPAHGLLFDFSLSPGLSGSKDGGGTRLKLPVGGGANPAHFELKGLILGFIVHAVHAAVEEKEKGKRS